MADPKPVREFVIAQALYFRGDSRQAEQAGRSPDFQPEWSGPIANLLEEFGPMPDVAPFPDIVFARPLDKRQVLVVQVADRRAGDDGPERIGYRVLVIPRKKYLDFLGDPFTVADKLPPDWQAHGELPTLRCPEQMLPPPTVAQVREVLQRVKYAALLEDVPGEEQIEEEPDPAKHSEGPALLGGVQGLIDGGRLIFERPGPDPGLLKAFWTLLPQSNRAELWPATFAFNNHIPFDVLVVRHYTEESFPGYTTEEQAGDYPEGRYELSLQIAAEAGDQPGLDSLFRRRSSRETLNLGLTLLVAMTAVVLFSYLFQPAPPPAEVIRAEQSRIISGLAGMNNPFNAITYYSAAQEPLKHLANQVHE
jgi:hypothetical protein